MFKNYLKIAIRNIKRQKGYSAINILGLSFGLAISLIIAFYVMDDLTFDRMHENPENIFRVVTIESSGNQGFQTYSITSGPLMVALAADLPEVSASTRLFGFGQGRVGRGDREFNQNDPNAGIQVQAMITDPGFFDVFSFKLLRGDPEKILQGPNDVLLTQETADALFGSEDPMGKPLVIPGANLPEAYVAGIVQTPPRNSHIQYGMIGKLRPELNAVWWDSWENLMLTGYIKTVPGTNMMDVQNKMVTLARKNNFAKIYLPQLQPLLDVHLGSADHRYDGTNAGKNTKAVVYALTIIGILVLLIAAINFINLSSARSTFRAREVGLRKVVGSSRTQLITQFLGESVFLTLIAMVIAMAGVQASLPYLDTFLGKNLHVNFIANPILFVLMISIAVIIGLLAGIYPALVLSSFKPITVLKGKFKTSNAGVFLRRVLVIFQFAITSALILGVLIVLVQIDYIKNMDLGYNRQGLVVVPNFVGNGEDLLKNEMQKMPFIEETGRMSNLPGGTPMRIEAIPEGMDRENSRMFQQYVVDEGLIDILDLEIIAGRKFSKEFASDTLENIIINEKAQKLAGWLDPIGKRLDVIDINGALVSRRVIGVVKDFHYSNARQAIEAMYLVFNPRQSNLLYARINDANQEQVLADIEEKHRALFPDRRFNSIYMENFFDRQFNNDRDFAGNIGFFSAVAIFIACLGLLGLVSFAVSQRRQEVAVRKVLGSSERRIVFLLAVDFLKWVAVANLIAWPAGYFGMSVWLNDFVYKVPFTLWPYLVSGFGTLIIALITISYQSIKAARANPVESLRME